MPPQQFISIDDGFFISATFICAYRVTGNSKQPAILQAQNKIPSM